MGDVAAAGAEGAPGRAAGGPPHDTAGGHRRPQRPPRPPRGAVRRGQGADDAGAGGAQPGAHREAGGLSGDAFGWPLSQPLATVTLDGARRCRLCCSRSSASSHTHRGLSRWSCWSCWSWSPSGVMFVVVVRNVRRRSRQSAKIAWSVRAVFKATSLSTSTRRWSDLRQSGCVHRVFTSC